MVKKRLGSGGSGVRTDVYTYDSLGRVTYVDHDTEHPVNCSTAPSGTVIEDDEYRYDNCTGDVPSGFSCSNGLGRLTISRAVLQCSSQVVVKSGRWYNYDVAGRLAQVAYAGVNGTSIGVPAIMNYAYTSAGRVSSYQSPLNTAYGTSYTYGTTNGLVTQIGTSLITNAIATSVSYAPFGPLSVLTAPVSGSQSLTYLANLRAADYQLSHQTWQLMSGGPIYLLNQTLGRTPAGAINSRLDMGDGWSSRYYGYDSLMRMTCEARGSTSWAPSASDCTTSSSHLASLVTYGDGQSGTSPSDVRLSSFLRSDDTSYVSPSTETLSYSSGSTQIQGVSRTGSSLVVGYDALGRRSYDYDSFDPIRSRRNYTYLPNGQLGTISGQTSSGQLYSFSILYDERGRPVFIAAGDLYSLYWDDANRLISVQIIFPLIRPCPGQFGGICSGARWHYHYLGDRLIAMTREMVGSTQVMRYWASTDERGLIYRLTDGQGLTNWQARWDASGWRTLIGTPQPEMWVPFGLPGQIILGQTVTNMNGQPTMAWGTEAYASGTGGTWTRPPIALNGWRAYDPVTGAFLQSDPADQQGGRTNPEGYVYGRSSPVNLDDRMGASSAPFWIGCNSERQGIINQALLSAISDILTCHKGECGFGGSESIRRAWVYSLESSDYSVACLDPAANIVNAMSFGIVALGPFTLDDGKPPPSSAETRWEERGSDTSLLFLPIGLVSNGLYPRGMGVRELCLPQLLAHEHLHRVNARLSMSSRFSSDAGLAGMFAGRNLYRYLNGAYPLTPGDETAEDSAIYATVDRAPTGDVPCVKCSH